MLELSLVNYLARLLLIHIGATTYNQVILRVSSFTHCHDHPYSSFTHLTLEQLMQGDLHPPLTALTLPSPDLLNPLEVINIMIDLRVQLAEIEQQIQALQPAFFAACIALNTDKITIERATITRRLTPGQWAYSSDIVEQEDLLKQLKKQFQQTHEPIGGREVTWAVKLLLTTV